MASGKTETGKALARITGWSLVDTDAQIVARAGRPIDEIFQQEGEPAFRVLEAEIVRELCAGSGRIIAAGGGAFTVPENRERMLAGGIVVCLSARPETIHRRITEPTSQGKNREVSKQQPVRPLLAGDNPLARIRELLTQRAPAYAQAHFTVGTDDQTPEQVARRILELCGIEPRTWKER
jgi:shikimate kinase